MAEILAIDFGTKRTGIAATDPLQIVASGLVTLPTKEVISYLINYLESHEVETCVVGQPKRYDGTFSEVETEIKKFVQNLKTQIPSLEVRRFDERFTSKLAKQAILMSGAKKKKRQQKELVDEVSATIILQSYMQMNENRMF